MAVSPALCAGDVPALEEPERSGTEDPHLHQYHEERPERV